MDAHTQRDGGRIAGSAAVLTVATIPERGGPQVPAPFETTDYRWNARDSPRARSGMKGNATMPRTAVERRSARRGAKILSPVAQTPNRKD